MNDVPPPLDPRPLVLPMRVALRTPPLHPLMAAAWLGLWLAFSGQAAAAPLNHEVRRLVREAELEPNRMSLLAVDLRSGRVLLRHRAEQPLMPASNMKLLTTAASLYLLGPDFRFNTTLGLTEPQAWTPPPAHPVLVLRGDGDPVFGDLDLLAKHDLDLDTLLDLWIHAARQTGHRRFSALVLDENIFDRQYLHPTWEADDLDQPYAAPIAGLNLNNNCLNLQPSPTRPGRPPRVHLEPRPGFLREINKATTGDRDAFWAQLDSRDGTLTYRGEIRQQNYGTIQMPLKDPPRFLGKLLASRFREAGLDVQRIVRMPASQRAPQGRVLHSVQSHLAMVIARCNKDSQNMVAEGLLKRMGHEATQRPGSWPSGAAAVEQWIREELPQVSGSSVRIADGSGLSRRNRLSSELLVGLLRRLYRDEERRGLFLASLAVAGEDGTLHDRMRRGFTGAVLAKSGYIRSVSALSGYVIHPANAVQSPAHGEPSHAIAFSLLFNGFPQGKSNAHFKRLQDRIVQRLDEYLAEHAAGQPAMGG